MLSIEDEKALKKDFWAQFEIYSRPHLKENGKYKWILHNTRISGVELKFFVDRERIGVVLEVNHKNENRRLRVFEALNDYKTLIESGIENIQWKLISKNSSGKETSEVSTFIDGVDYYEKNNWAHIYSFMCKNMLQMEANFLEIFESFKEEIKN